MAYYSDDRTIYSYDNEKVNANFYLANSSNIFLFIFYVVLVYTQSAVDNINAE